MYWYQQRKGERLSLIVLTTTYGDPDFGDSDQSKFGVGKGVGSLTVKNAQPDDSAMYFCSWNHSAERDNMSNAHCLCVSVFFLCLAVTILGKSVVQTPSDLLKKENEFAKIKCTNNVQNYDVVQWYKQSQSTMQFMGYLNIKQEVKETKFDDKIKLEGNGRNNVTLTINTLMLNDSAVYFCAAYYTVLRITSD
ncbi:T-cell receptor beta variable [Labeo rohita]|nr:T-cell receptor beta variable [Labeo rohita]